MVEYVLLSSFLKSPTGGGHWVADMAIPERVLKHGAIVSGVLVDGIDSAAAIFADLLAQKEFGENARAWIVQRDCSDEYGSIFDMTPGTPHPGGGHYLEQEMRFAVRIATR
jgi:hypothetical protein